MERRTYFLDLPTVLMYLQHQSQAFVLMTVLDHVQTGYVVVEQGKIKRCIIKNKTNILVEGDVAYKKLSSMAAWQVLTDKEAQVFLHSPMVPQVQQTNPFLPAIRAVPDINMLPITFKRQIMIDQLNLTQKQRMQLRMVLTMINGQRTAQEIKTQLHLAPETVDEILRYLVSLDVISY